MMDINTIPATAISNDIRRMTKLRFVVAPDMQEMTPAEQWVRVLAGDAQARIALLARIMPRPGI